MWGCVYFFFQLAFTIICIVLVRFAEGCGTQQGMTVALISCQILFSSATKDRWDKSNDRYPLRHARRGRKIARTSHPLV